MVTNSHKHAFLLVTIAIQQCIFSTLLYSTIYLIFDLSSEITQYFEYAQVQNFKKESKKQNEIFGSSHLCPDFAPNISSQHCRVVIFSVQVCPERRHSRGKMSKLTDFNGPKPKNSAWDPESLIGLSLVHFLTILPLTNQEGVFCAWPVRYILSLTT